jgi:hypothetical protein
LKFLESNFNCNDSIAPPPLPRLVPSLSSPKPGLNNSLLSSIVF